MDNVMDMLDQDQPAMIAMFNYIVHIIIANSQVIVVLMNFAQHLDFANQSIH